MQLLYLLLARAAAGGPFSITAAYCFAPARGIRFMIILRLFSSGSSGLYPVFTGASMLSILGYLIICAMAVWMYLYNTGKLGNAGAMGRSR